MLDVDQGPIVYIYVEKDEAEHDCVHKFAIFVLTTIHMPVEATGKWCHVAPLPGTKRDTGRQTQRQTHRHTVAQTDIEMERRGDQAWGCWQVLLLCLELRDKSYTDVSGSKVERPWPVVACVTITRQSV